MRKQMRKQIHRMKRLNQWPPTEAELGVVRNGSTAAIMHGRFRQIYDDEVRANRKWREENAVAEGSPPAKRRREGRNREYLHVPKHLHLRVPIAAAPLPRRRAAARTGGAGVDATAANDDWTFTGMAEDEERRRGGSGAVAPPALPPSTAPAKPRKPRAPAKPPAAMTSTKRVNALRKHVLTTSSRAPPPQSEPDLRQARRAVALLVKHLPQADELAVQAILHLASKAGLTVSRPGAASGAG